MRPYQKFILRRAEIYRTFGVNSWFFDIANNIGIIKLKMAAMILNLPGALKAFQSPLQWWRKSRSVSRNLGHSAKHLRLDLRDEVAIVRLNSPGKVNVLTEDLMTEMADAIQTIDKDPGIIAGVIMSSKPGCFVAGADIDMIENCESREEATRLSRDGQRMLDLIENSKKPIVAAMQGACLGGGLELALACHYRLAIQDSKTKFGLPEVKLGLLPGAGGTQRLPRCVGILSALDLMIKGQNLSPTQAKKIGLVDLLIPPLGPGVKGSEQMTEAYLEATAILIANSLASAGAIRKVKRNLSQDLFAMAMHVEFVKEKFFEMAKAKVTKRTKGLYPAPYQILDVVRKGLDKGPRAGYDAEAVAFGELAMSHQSKGLVSLFHGRTECKKNRVGSPKRPVRNIAVLGAGFMGAGIAQVAAGQGYSVTLKDSTERGLTRGFNQMEKNLEKLKNRGQMSRTDIDALMSNVTFQLDYRNFDKVDLVVEAVFEDLELKNRIIEELEAHVPEHCIIASNTSALPIQQIASTSKRPEKIIGMHYFSPVDKMELLEIVVTPLTSKDTIASAVQVGLQQGKIVIIVRDGPGFYTTRILAAMMSELTRLLQEGVHPRRLDNLTTSFGFPVGACTLADEVGLDVASHIARDLTMALGPRASGGSIQMLEDLVDNGNLGRKSGRGLFEYPDKNVKDRAVNIEALEIITYHKIEPRLPHTDEDILMRMVTRFVNEALLCLQENILPDPLEGEIGAVFGLGFPPFTGGPFHYVDRVGARTLVDKMGKYEEAYGEAFSPCQLLQDHARDSTRIFFPYGTSISSSSSSKSHKLMLRSLA